MQPPPEVLIMQVEHTGQLVELKFSDLEDETKCVRDGDRIHLKRKGITLVPVPHEDRWDHRAEEGEFSPEPVYKPPLDDWKAASPWDDEGNRKPKHIIGRELEALRKQVRKWEGEHASSKPYMAVPVAVGEEVWESPLPWYSPTESRSHRVERSLSSYQVWASFPRLEPGGPPDQPFERFTAGEAARSRHGGRKNSLEVHWLPRPVDTKTGKPVEIPNPYRRDRKYTPGEAVLEYLVQPRKGEWTAPEAPISKPWPLHEQQGFGAVTLDNFDQEVEE
jgi:hypothetical protein